MSPYDDEDREKPSWREIDRRRDHSRHVTGEEKSSKERILRSDWAKKQHLKEAEKFFQGKKGTAAYKTAYTALHEKYGTPLFQEAAKNFLEQFGLPDDWGTLLLLLDLPDPKWVIDQRGFKGKLRVLVMDTKNAGVRQEIETILEHL